MRPTRLLSRLKKFRPTNTRDRTDRMDQTARHRILSRVVSTALWVTGRDGNSTASSKAGCEPQAGYQPRWTLSGCGAGGTASSAHNPEPSFLSPFRVPLHAGSPLSRLRIA